MKNNKKIIMYAMLIALLSINNFTSCKKNPEEAAAKAAIHTGALSDQAANVGLGTLKWLKAEGQLPAAKEVAQSVGENAGLASTTAIIAAGTAAAPYVAGAVTAYYVTQAGTYVYYQYYPTPEQIAQNEQFLAEAEEHRIAATQAREKLDDLMAKAAFRKCLKNNLNSERNTIGIPSACASALHAYAMAVSGEQVDRDVETFKKYSPQGA